MFHAVVSILMLCSLGAHAVLGCCWHHAHADADCETPAESETQMLQQSRPHIHLGCGDHQHHGEDAGETEPTRVPHNPADCPHDHRCGELSCEYVKPAPSKLPVPEMDQLDVTPRLIALCDLVRQTLDPNADRRSETVCARASGSLDVRDATQIWLL